MSTATAEKVAYVDATSAAEVFERISGALRAAGHANPTAWIDAMVANYGDQVKDEQPMVARFVANSHWRYILGLYGANTDTDTSNARFCMDDHCNEEEWFKLLTKIVVPCIMKCGL